MIKCEYCQYWKVDFGDDGLEWFGLCQLNPPVIVNALVARFLKEGYTTAIYPATTQPTTTGETGCAQGKRKGGSENE
jgi:hypothetical protein